MWIFKQVKAVSDFLSQKRSENHSIGFVPTMGALHAGHISLIAESRNNTDITVSSIFVNPTQFNDKSDLEKYPRTIEKDINTLYEAKCDVLFLPDVEDVYPAGMQLKHYDLGHLEQVFEGSSRQGHFQGVCQVVDRLFDIVQPDEAFFGQKDYQQCMVINRLIETTPEFREIKMRISPTVREPNGLARSSRNMRLSEKEKQTAATIYRTLLFLKQNLKTGDVTGLLNKANQILSDAGFRPDYISIANAKTLEPIGAWDGETPLVALVAAFLGEVRLIDNMIITD